MKRFFQPVDLRSRKAMIDYLEDHFRYFTMNSWNRSQSYACNLKIYNHMASKEFAELLTNAISGDYSSLEKIIDLYMPLIDKSSIVDGQFDEDCKQYILLQVALQIMKFKI